MIEMTAHDAASLLDTTIEREIQIFDDYTNLSGSAYCSIKKVAPFIMRIRPREVRQKTKTLGIIAITHGNEVLGLPIVNRLIGEILAGKIMPATKILFAAGNVPSARAGKRFIDRDLNRSFALNSNENAETVRAREIETHFFDRCDYVLDLHQTIQPSHSPFFFFYYFSQRQFDFLNAVNPGLPVIVTLNDALHGQNGQTTNEYLKNQGKVCLTVELGEKGFFADKFDLGLTIAKKMIATVQNAEQTIEPMANPERLLKIEVGYRVQHSGTRLDEGWRNLQEVVKGQRLGHSDGGPIHSPISGYILFPKYAPDPAIGQELFCICKQIEPRELLNDG